MRKIFINCQTIRTKNDTNGNPRAIACISVRLLDKNKLEKFTSVLSSEYSYMSELQACEHVLSKVLESCPSMKNKTYKILREHSFSYLTKKELEAITEDLLFVMIDQGTTTVEIKNFKRYPTNLKYEAYGTQLSKDVKQFLVDARLMSVKSLLK